MDYTTQPLSFKIKKALRYIHLFGIKRTWIKVQGQYHMKRAYDTLPPIPAHPAAHAHVGILGCGNFAFSNIAYYLKKNCGSIIHACMDIDVNKAASLFKTYDLNYYTCDAKKVIDDPAIDTVYIASNHASHAEYAIEALHVGKNVHIEKPHVVNNDQLLRLCRTMATSKGKVGLGFNRPNSKFGHAMKEVLNSQDGAGMYNWFIAGHEIAPDHWYFKEEEGGRILGNLCHWTDFVYQMVPSECRYPIQINPTRSAKSDCDIAVSYTFGDGSISVITFSAKGHTFEGVRERFAGHKGNVLISMDDFKTLTIEDVDQKRVRHSWNRDHGHESNILNSYKLSGVAGEESRGCTLPYVWETGELFLKTKEALEENTIKIVEAFNMSRLDPLVVTSHP